MNYYHADAPSNQMSSDPYFAPLTSVPVTATSNGKERVLAHLNTMHIFAREKPVRFIMSDRQVRDALTGKMRPISQKEIADIKPDMPRGLRFGFEYV